MVDINCNETLNSFNNNDDDKITASQMLGFGTGSNLSAFHLFFGFSFAMFIGV